MHYYQFNIPRFNNATRHLNRLERSVYRDMIDLYYDTEVQLNKDIDIICRKIIAPSEQERTAVQQVLNEFFILTEQGYLHERMQEEVDAYHANISNKVKGGIASGIARKSKKSKDKKNSKKTKEQKGTPVQQKRTPVHNYKLITKNQELYKKDTSGADEAPPKRKNEKKSNAKKLNFDLDDMALATHMHDCVKEHYPEQKISLDHWADGVRMLRRIDNRDIDNLRNLWDWAMAHDKGPGNFSWCKNIKSPLKLRDKKDGITYYDIIAQQMGDDILNVGGYQGKIQTGENKTIERLQDRSWAKDLIID